MKKIGVVLSGCGVMDGSEIHEAVITLLALDRAGVETVIMAPDVELEVVNHLTNEPTGERRSVLAESARIARGQIKDLAEVTAKDLDAVIFPGGYGAAKNLSNFASAGAEAKINTEVARLLTEMHQAGKPIGVICIAPATLAAALGKSIAPTVTIGTDADTAAAIEQTGSKHQACEVSEFVVDEANKIVSTPAYMLAGSISEAAQGIEKLVGKIVELA